MSFRRKSDTDILARAAGQLLLVDEEIDHQAISDGDDNIGKLQSRKSYFSKPEPTTTAITGSQYPTRLDATDQPVISEIPRQSLRSQQMLPRSSFASIRSMLRNFNLEDET